MSSSELRDYRSAADKNYFKKEQKKFCSNPPSPIFALPNDNRVSKERKSGRVWE